ncbi:squalene synthase HpnC [Sphingomonas bacterium]|uniref:squalene synthase HpnC n=1 Tax=Sphingomonas bacterium TaxID=1895847 RepID=UPI00157731AD|nr:squalene synthase HpnC [Sphingomonas bacterium]
MATASLSSGKGHRDENFPVASWLLARRHRAPVIAFYRFARAADDLADHETAPAAEKLRQLAAMRRGLDGASGGAAEALALREVLDDAGLSDVHARDLLDAFEQDVTVNRYADWAGLIDYCRRSAMPVGRFVLDVHGEDRAATWPASDALCAALQIVNHLQDCGKDYRELDRVYLPADVIAAAGARIDDLGAAKASPALLATIRDAARRTRALLVESAPFAGLIRDRRLAAEVAVIQRLAEDLTERLLTRDPLSERVHHRAPEALRLAAGPALRQLVRRR